MDPKNEADQKLAEEYWLNQSEGQLVEGKPVYDVTWFKWEANDSSIDLFKAIFIFEFELLISWYRIKHISWFDIDLVERKT